MIKRYTVLHHLLVGGLLLLLPLVATAHQANQTYIYLRVYDNAVEGHIDVNAGDLNLALGIELPEDFTEEDLAPYVEQIQAYFLEHAAFSSPDRAHPIEFLEPTVQETNLGQYAQMHFRLANTDPVPERFEVTFDAIFEQNPTHQNMVLIEYDWKAGVHNNEANFSLLMTKGDATQILEMNESSVMNGFWAMIKSGMWHIWIGLDHILFLLALLFPSVVRRMRTNDEQEIPANTLSSTSEAITMPQVGQWVPVARFRPALMYVLKIISLFTVAHTITLSLAALGVVNLPGRLVESIIALSIALAAYHNIRPIFKNEWVIAFGFGLFHGFGFASVLGDIGLSGDYLTLSLLGFNLGVEIGQVTIICAIFPVLYLLRNTATYPKILFYGSVLLILISIYWVIERVFEIDFLLDNYIAKAFRLFFQAIGLG